MAEPLRDQVVEHLVAVRLRPELPTPARRVGALPAGAVRLEDVDRLEVGAQAPLRLADRLTGRGTGILAAHAAAAMMSRPTCSAT